MAKTLYSILTILLLTACGSELRTRNICTCDEQKRASKFVADHIKDANNMSDEEMEDVIYQLRASAIALHCHTEGVWTRHDGMIDWEKEKIDSCRIIIY
jgi:outer membrane lipopolysaccharide assembly protein LptE/RlpB